MEEVLIENRDASQIFERAEIVQVEAMPIEMTPVERNVAIGVVEKRGEQTELVGAKFFGRPIAGGESRTDSPDCFNPVCDRSQSAVRLQFVRA